MTEKQSRRGLLARLAAAVGGAAVLPQTVRDELEQESVDDTGWRCSRADDSGMCDCYVAGQKASLGPATSGSGIFYVNHLSDVIVWDTKKHRMDIT